MVVVVVPYTGRVAMVVVGMLLRPTLLGGLLMVVVVAVATAAQLT